MDFDFFENCTAEKARLINPVVLAYVGDGVQTLFVRKKLALLHDLKSSELNKMEAKSVCASAQARAARKLTAVFTEEELSIFKRARNSKKGSKAKNSTLGDYSKSTGFEAVIGFLYLSGQTDRLNYILNLAEEFTAETSAETDEKTQTYENVRVENKMQSVENATEQR